jgi:hypothetical protein
MQHHGCCEPHDVVRVAERVCDAARLAALDAIDAVARIVVEQGAEASDRSRDVAGQMLYRAAVMQNEIDQFGTAVRRRR